jgi:zinc transporter
MNESNGLIHACLLDGNGGGRQFDWPEVRSWTAAQGLLWVHLDRTGSDTQRWLAEDSGIDPIIREALLEHDVRPRVLPVDDALLIILRGVNLNPGANPEDMVGVRCWIEPTRIITMRHHRVMAINDIREALAAGAGPTGRGDFLVSLVDGLTRRMGPIIDDLDDRVDRLEDEVLTEQSASLRGQLSLLRRQTIMLRRYLAPQREVVSRLYLEPADWLDGHHRGKLREVGDRTIRYLEDLDAARERAAVIQEELNNRLSDQMNNTMYLLTIVAAVLLPPSLITGIFGINVGGMPGVENSFGFTAVILSIIVLAIVEVVLLRRLKWI